MPETNWHLHCQKNICYRHLFFILLYSNTCHGSYALVKASTKFFIAASCTENTPQRQTIQTQGLKVSLFSGRIQLPLRGLSGANQKIHVQRSGTLICFQNLVLNSRICFQGKMNPEKQQHHPFYLICCNAAAVRISADLIIDLFTQINPREQAPSKKCVLEPVSESSKNMDPEPRPFLF